MEEWRELAGFPRYQISNLGNMLGKRGKPLATSFDKDGYKIVTLDSRMPTCKTIKVHRKVFETFVGPIPEGLMINHKNGIKHDNQLGNLEVVTQSENVLHAFRVLGVKGRNTNPRRGTKHPNAKLTEGDVRQIKALLSKGLTVYAISKAYPQVCGMTVRRIAKGLSWAHVN